MDAHVILSLRDTVSLVASGPRELTLEAPAGRITLTNLSPGMYAAWQRLAAGASVDSIAAAVRAEDDVIAGALMHGQLKRCDALGLLTYSVHAGPCALVTIVPMVSGVYFSAAAVDAAARLRLSRFAYCRRLDERLILESPLSTSRAVLAGELGGALIAALAVPRTCDEVHGLLSALQPQPALDGGSIRSCLTLLTAAGLLSVAGADGRLPEESDPSLAQWEFHDLAFHARSRLGRHDYPFGGTFPFIGQIAPMPALPPARATEMVVLPALDPQRIGAQDPPFFDVLERRVSVREHGQVPITVQQLGEFLFRTARVRSVRPPDATRPYEASSRPYPGGGAAYELELYLTVNLCTGLVPGLYRYDPAGHQLERLAASPEQTDQLLRDAQNAAALSAPPHILITLASRFGRLSWKYRGMAYATTLKNAGVLMQTMYLVATAMDLAPCALGGGNSAAFAAAAGTSQLDEPAVGEFILGSRERV